VPPRCHRGGSSSPCTGSRDPPPVAGLGGQNTPSARNPDTIVQLNADQVTAAKIDDVEGFVEAKDGLEAVQPELERATAAAGVAICAEVHK
jgi:hypothetical protein